MEKDKKQRDKDEERRQRYKALRAKVKAQTQRTAQQNKNHYKLTSKKAKKRNDHTITSKTLKQKKHKKARPQKKKPQTTHDHIHEKEKKQPQKRISVKVRKANTVPYYLRKHDFDEKYETQSVSVNDFQRKKYKELLKISQQTEWKYTYKYMAQTYGKRQNNNYTSIFENIHIDFDNIILKICIEMLLILHESWNGRIQIIGSLVDQLCASTITNDEFAIKMSKFLCAIGVQFSDSRSLVIQAMNTQLHRLCSLKPEQFCFFAPYLLQQISQTWPIRIQALREAGMALSQTIIVMCFPFDKNRVLLYTMFELIQSKHAAIRSKSIQLICFMLCNISLLEKINANQDEEKLLNRISRAVIASINDASSDVRSNGYKMLFKLNKIAPNKWRNILQSMSKAKIKKFYEANEMKKKNILITDKEEEKQQSNIFTQTCLTDFDFNITFEDTRSHPRDLEKRIRDTFVNRQTKLQNKRDKTVFFQDLVSAERIGIHNNLPLLTLLNDVFVRCKLNAKYSKLFNVDYFMSKYALSTYNMFCSAIKQYQYMFPIIITSDDTNYIDDNGQIFVDYTIGFLRFIEMRKRKLLKFKQYDLVIIPQNMQNDKEEKSLDAILQQFGLNYVSVQLNDDIYNAFCKCFKELKKGSKSRHIVFVIDRRIENESFVHIYAINVKSTLKAPYNDIGLYPEFHIAKSKEFLFGNKNKENRKYIKKKKKNKGKNNKILLNGILSDIKINKFALFCHIWNTDCIRLYSMINQYFSRFLPNIDMVQIWPKIFRGTHQRYNLSQDIPLKDNQFEQFYALITHQKLMVTANQ